MEVIPSSCKILNGRIIFEKNKFDFYNHEEEKVSLYKKAAEKLVLQLRLIQVMARQKIEIIDAKIDKHLATGGTLENFPKLPDETIMNVDLSHFGIWETQLSLEIFNNKVYIWLKLMIHPEEDPLSLHFVRGVKLEVNDNCDELAKYIEKFDKKKPFYKNRK